MAYDKSPAAMAARKRYTEKNYDNLTIWVPKGSKSRYKEAAEKEGKSLREFVISALELRIKG